VDSREDQALHRGGNVPFRGWVTSLPISHFTERLDMKKPSSSRISRTDWKRVRSMKDRDIKLTPEHPELDLRHIARVIVRKGLKPAVGDSMWKQKS
jgi:hypothetical protein